MALNLRAFGVEDKSPSNLNLSAFGKTSSVTPVTSTPFSPSGGISTTPSFDMKTTTPAVLNQPERPKIDITQFENQINPAKAINNLVNKVATMPVVKDTIIEIGKRLSGTGVLAAIRAGKSEEVFDQAYNAIKKEQAGDTSVLNQFLYQLGDSAPQTVFGVALNFVPVAGKALSTAYWTALSSAGELERKGKIDVGNVGIDVLGDRMLGTSIESLLKAPTQTIFNTAKNSFITEGGTEVAQDLLKYGNDYKNAGTPEEKKIIIDEVKDYFKSGQILMTAGVGGLTGAGIGAGMQIGQEGLQMYSKMKPGERQRGSIKIPDLGVGGETPSEGLNMSAFQGQAQPVEPTEEEGIQDFGEKIGGAKKETWSKSGLTENDLLQMNEREVEKYLKKDNIWAKNYQQLVDSGINESIVMFIKNVRDSVPPKIAYLRKDDSPELKKARNEQYISFVREVKNATEQVKTLDDVKNFYRNFVINNGYAKPIGGTTQIEYTQKQQDNPFLTNKLRKASRIVSAFDMIQLAEDAKKQQFGAKDGEKIPAGIEVKFDGTKGDWFVIKRSGRFAHILKDRFVSEQEAKEWIKTNVQSIKKKTKKRFVPPQLSHINRTGYDYRDGNKKQIKGKDLIDTFGFKGGEFGNWMTEKDRQTSLNYAYDALRDLADALGIDPKGVALDKTLSISFGSRGIAGAAAHYEPNRKVFNLTKMNGAGSTAHEWFHALEDYLVNTLHIKNAKSLEDLKSALKEKPATPEEVQANLQKRIEKNQKNLDYVFSYIEARPEFKALGEEKKAEYNALKARVKAGDKSIISTELNNFVKKNTGRVISPDDRSRLEYFSIPPVAQISKVPTQYKQDSVAADSFFAKADGYWQSEPEMLARAFASYITDKTNKASDYLSGHSDVTIFPDEKGNLRYAFPVGDERVVIDKAFDNLFAELKDKGVFQEKKPDKNVKLISYKEKPVTTTEELKPEGAISKEEAIQRGLPTETSSGIPITHVERPVKTEKKTVVEVPKEKIIPVVEPNIQEKKSIVEPQETKKYKTTVNIQDKEDLKYLGRILSADNINDIQNGKLTNFRGIKYEDLARVNIISETPKTLSQQLEGKIKPFSLPSNILYHGTSPKNIDSILNQGFKRGSELPKDAFRGGGYDAVQNSISFSTDPKIASNFTGTGAEGVVFKTSIKSNSNIVQIDGITHAEDLNDLIPELKKLKVDAVYIPDEKEIVVINNSVIEKVKEYKEFKVIDRNKELVGTWNKVENTPVSQSALFEQPKVQMSKAQKVIQERKQPKKEVKPKVEQQLPEHLQQRKEEVDLKKMMVKESPFASAENRFMVDREGRIRELGDVDNKKLIKKIEDRMAETGVEDATLFSEKIEGYLKQKDELNILEKSLNEAIRDDRATEVLSNKIAEQTDRMRAFADKNPELALLITDMTSEMELGAKKGYRLGRKLGETAGKKEVRTAETIKRQALRAKKDAEIKKITGDLKDRRAKVRAIQDALDLSASDIKEILGDRNISIMKPIVFEDVLQELYGRGMQLQDRTEARMQLKATIWEKEFRNVENLQKALKYPAISEMTTDQLKEFDKILQPFQQGDTFLSKRKLELMHNTSLSGVKTIREARKILAEKLGIPESDLNKVGKVGEFDRMKGDTNLVQTDPFYKVMVEGFNSSILQGDLEFLKMEQDINRMMPEARKTTGIKENIGQKIAPTDEKIFAYMEAEDKSAIRKELSPEQLKVAEYMREKFSSALAYEYEQGVLKKSRYENNYITHIRRGFFEALKAGEIKNAFTELFAQYKQDEAVMNILDQKTGEVLPLEKFFKFAMQRSGELSPTKNVAKAFLSYMQVFERKKALDRIIPEIMAYVDVLTPQETTKGGIYKDDRLASFVKEYLNTKKGRRSKLFVQPGGKAEFILKSVKGLTNLLDLAVNIPVQISSSGGVHAGLYTTLGASRYATGLKRLVSAKGRAMVKEYENFTGRNPFNQLLDASTGLPDKMYSSMFILFKDATVRGNKIHLLGSLTEEEWKTGKVSPAKLAALQTEVGRWLPVEGSKSILGSTTEGGLLTQYKSWAIPPLRAAKDDLSAVLKLAKNLKNPFASREFWELFRAAQVSALVGLIAMAIGNDSDKKVSEMTFTEKLINKLIQDSLSMMSAVDPRTYASAPRTIGFATDLMTAIGDLVHLETLKTTGGLKGVSELKKMFTPVLARNLQSPVEKGVPGSVKIPNIKIPNLKIPSIKIPNIKI